MDKYDFMNFVDDVFETCKTKEEIELRAKQMIEMIKTQESLNKLYLDSGIR